MKKRKSYDKEFKEMAVSLVNSGKKASEVAADLGIACDLVNRWRRESLKYGTGSFSGNGIKNLSEEQKQIADLKKALRETQIENEILKKAVGIFSKRDSNYMNS